MGLPLRRFKKTNAYSGQPAERMTDCSILSGQLSDNEQFSKAFIH